MSSSRPYDESTATTLTKNTLHEIESANFVKSLHSSEYHDGEKLKTALVKELNKLEIPAGMLPDILKLSGRKIVIIVDDSGSMNGEGSIKNKSRWDEAKERLIAYLSLLQYIPTQDIQIDFLNRDDFTLKANQNGARWTLASAMKKINESFSDDPNHGTPLFDNLRSAFSNAVNEKTTIVAINDGTPDDLNAGAECVKTRKHPHNSPVHLVGCTNNPNDIKWFDKVDAGPFVAALSPFNMEKEQVKKVQGTLLNYTPGIHLVASLIGAETPYLDNLDEKTLTIEEFEKIQGRKVSDEEYKKYYQQGTKFEKCGMGNFESYAKRTTSNLVTLSTFTSTSTSTSSATAEAKPFEEKSHEEKPFEETAPSARR
jgi:hypothetical protein